MRSDFSLNTTTNAICRRRRRRIEIPRRVDEDDDPYHGIVWGIWPDSIGEEDRVSLDAGTGEAAEERGIAATTTGHRSNGAKLLSQFRYLGGLVNEDGELTQEINHRSRAAWACIGRFSRELLDRPGVPLLRRTHHRLLLRVIGYRRERGTYRQLS